MSSGSHEAGRETTSAAAAEGGAAEGGDEGGAADDGACAAAGCGGGGSGGGDGDDLLASFAAELEALPDEEPACTLREEGGGVLLIRELCRHILTYLPATDLARLGHVCREFHDCARNITRHTSRRLLREAGLAPQCATAVEAAIFDALRPAPLVAEYLERVRMSVANLRLNADMRLRLASGALAPRDFARMSAAQMLRREAAAEHALMRARAIEQARRPAPAGDMRDTFACPACGGTRQWVRRHQRLGTLDKHTELLVCCDCLAIVPPLSSRIAAAVSFASLSSSSSSNANGSEADRKRARA
jgi:hypothetical protein